MKLVCPKCKGTNIAQAKSMNGPMICGDCGFKVADQSVNPNPFYDQRELLKDKLEKCEAMIRFAISDYIDVAYEAGIEPVDCTHKIYEIVKKGVPDESNNS